MQDTEATTTTSRRDSRFDGGRVAQPLDVLVDRGVLLDVGVGLRDVRLGLVVVVVGDEVLDGVVRQHLAQLVGQLRGQRLVRRHHQRRAAAAARSARPWWPTCRCRWRRAAPRPARRPRSRRSSSSMAAGWSPAGWYSLTTSKRPPVRGISPTGRNSECATGTSGWAALPGTSVAKATRSRVRAAPDSFRRAIGRMGASGAVHPPKTALFDVAAGVNIDTKGCARAVDEYRVTPFGLYMSRAMVEPADRALGGVVAAARARAVRHRLVVEPGPRPRPGLLPGRLRDRAGTATGGGSPTTTWTSWCATGAAPRWSTSTSSSPRWPPGCSSPATAEAALHRTHRALDGIAAHGHDLDAWLGGLGIALSWKPRPGTD